MNKKVIYLTGAPATGKTTLTQNLASLIPDLQIFTYSEQLLKVVGERNSKLTSKEDLRRESSTVVTHEDVNETDLRLLNLIEADRTSKDIIIDSHPVTIEKFGFRITPFSKQHLQKLKPDVIVCLYAEPEIIYQRIQKESAGRPLPNIFDLTLHMNLQAQIATQYAFEVAAKLYLLNSSDTQDDLLQSFLKVTKLSSHG